jgi:serine protein kinase
MAAWEGTFRDYLSLVLQQPTLAQRTHARLYSMIHAAGVRVDEAGKEHYAFFERDLFGIDEPRQSGGIFWLRARLRRRAAYPPALWSAVFWEKPAGHSAQACWKSVRTLTQAVYAIAECPQHEDPMNLIPHAMRREFRKKQASTSRESYARCA